MVTDRHYQRVTYMSLRAIGFISLQNFMDGKI